MGQKRFPIQKQKLFPQSAQIDRWAGKRLHIGLYYITASMYYSFISERIGSMVRNENPMWITTEEICLAIFSFCAWWKRNWRGYSSVKPIKLFKPFPKNSIMSLQYWNHWNSRRYIQWIVNSCHRHSDVSIHSAFGTRNSNGEIMFCNTLYPVSRECVNSMRCCVIMVLWK